MRLYLNTNGFGSSVLQMLLKTSIKPNLYYEIKNRIDEEVINGVTIKKPARRCKVYGCTSSKSKRDKLIELLYQRVKHHRDKFNTRELYNELATMVVKPNGKVEHDVDAHDDLIFSYLWALYVFYYGEELPTRFHLMKTEIHTDDDYDETSYNLEEEYNEGIVMEPETFKMVEDDQSRMVDDQIKILNSSKSMSYSDFVKIQIEQDNRALNRILSTKQGRKAVANTYHFDLDHLEKQNNMGYVDISNDINQIFYNTDYDFENDFKLNPDNRLIYDRNKILQGNLSKQFDKLKN